MIKIEEINKEIKKTYEKSNIKFINDVCSVLSKQNINYPYFLNNFVSQYPRKINNLKLIDLGIEIVTLLNNEYPNKLVTAYTVGSTGTGSSKSIKKIRPTFKVFGNNEHRLDYVIVKKTIPSYSDLDIEVIFKDTKNINQKLLQSKIKKLQNSGGYTDFPVDLRIISQRDVDWYLSTINEKPNYFLFRLILGTPLCIFGQKEFKKLKLISAKKMRGRQLLRVTPEFRRWKAFQTEKILLKLMRNKKILKLSKTTLKKMGDLYWYFSVRVNDPNGALNVSTFPPCKNSDSIKIKFGYNIN